MFLPFKKQHIAQLCLSLRPPPYNETMHTLLFASTKLMKMCQINVFYLASNCLTLIKKCDQTLNPCSFLLHWQCGGSWASLVVHMFSIYINSPTTHLCDGHSVYSLAVVEVRSLFVADQSLSKNAHLLRAHFKHRLHQIPTTETPLLCCRSSPMVVHTDLFSKQNAK